MELAGIASTLTLAQRINQAGMSKGTLDRIARDLRPIRAHEAEWIAAATKLPTAFFLDDVPVPEPPANEGGLAEVLAQLLAAVKQQNEAINKQNDLLDEQTRILERMDARLTAGDEVKDEVSALIDRRAQQIVAAKPAAERDPQPDPPPTPGAPKPRVVKPQPR
jgi:transcriptional regulator with XRE-family HTH domain